MGVSFFYFPATTSRTGRTRRIVKDETHEKGDYGEHFLYLHVFYSSFKKKRKKNFDMQTLLSNPYSDVSQVATGRLA